MKMKLYTTITESETLMSFVNLFIRLLFQRFLILVFSSKSSTHLVRTFVNSLLLDSKFFWCKTDAAVWKTHCSLKFPFRQTYCVDFGQSDFLNIHSFNWYHVHVDKALYLACSSIFGIMNNFVQYFVQLPVWHIRNTGCYAFIKTWKTGLYVSFLLRQKKMKIKDVKLTRVGLLLGIQ